MIKKEYDTGSCYFYLVRHLKHAKDLGCKVLGFSLPLT